MRRLPIVISLAVVVLAGTARSAGADGNGDLQAAGRIRALRLQMEENDARIAALESRLRTLRGGAAASSAAPAALPSTASGQISSWSDAAPAAAAITPAPAGQVPGGAAARTVTGSGGGSPARRQATATSRPARPNRLAGTRLSRGWNRNRVWTMLGPPEFVRGQRDGVQTWYYGSGWIRFQRGRVSSWNAGAPERLSQAALP